MNNLTNPDAESTLLSACLNNQGEFYRIADTLDCDVFTVPENRHIWETMLKVRASGGNVNLSTVSAHLMTANPEAVMHFLDVTNKPTTTMSGVDELLTDLLVRRKMLSAIMEAQQKLMQPLEPSESTLQELDTEIANCMSQQTTDLVTSKEACEQLMQNVFNNQELESGKPEIPTGLRGLDERGGLHATDLTIIAGETSMGKTSLALTIALNAAKQGVGVGIITLEMSVMQLAARMVSGDAEVSSSDILYTRLGVDPYNRVGTTTQEMANLPICFSRKAQTVSKICSWIRTQSYRKGARLFVIDYLQLISMGKIDNRVQEIGDICATLKRLAGDINVSIVLLSQLSRDRMNPYPSLSRLRGSGEIESNADNVIFVYRPEYYKTEGKNLSYGERFSNVSTDGTAEIIVAKGRNTGTTSFIAGYQRQYTRFYDLDSVPTVPATTQDGIRNMISNNNLPF